MGQRLWATHTINPGTENLADAMREMTSGVGPDVTVEAAGYPETLDAVFRLVRQFGTVIVFGVQGDDIVPVDTRLWLDKQATIIPTRGPQWRPDHPHQADGGAQGARASGSGPDGDPPAGLRRERRE